MKALIFSLSIAAATTSLLGAQTPEATLDRATKAYDGVKTVRATFSQSITNPLTGTESKARGEFVQQRDRGRLAIRFIDPAGDRIVADGKHVWVYLPSTNPGQVIRMKAAAGAAGTPDVTAQFLDAPKGRYAVSDAGKGTVNGRAARALLLVPRGANAPFRKATIWVDDADGLVRQFEVTEASGLVRRVTITSMRPNVAVSSSSFNFTPPRGVKV
ncbi:MAG TPA: outer membrane lipoprotein carrier protein LolA, partial [Gemmatimonadaceae bacterium]|nr:outer membrane lipoprotein carrier protein LolA [Gemmatimonadaceae bacterium]